jgi:transcriptional regulator GlxA family with amidase domain
VLLNPATSVRWPSSPCNSQPISVWTSAGITAGIDLALALIEEDHGFAVAKGVAQHLAVYHSRHGGQSQFAASVDLAPKNDRIAATLGYARDHISEVLTVERLAEAAGMSLRQFSRVFRAQTRVVERLRADLARGRIETTAEPVERVAEAVGFGDAENMRRASTSTRSRLNRSGAQFEIRSGSITAISGP